MEKKIKHAYTTAKASKKLRFGMVGVANTTVDVVILNILVNLIGLALVPANIISTTCAMICSFVLNKKGVFQSKDPRYARQLMLFFAVTLVGIWGLQTSVVFLVYNFLQTVTVMPLALDMNIAKVVGILVSMVWNYTWYSRVVFRVTEE